MRHLKFNNISTIVVRVEILNVCGDGQEIILQTDLVLLSRNLLLVNKKYFCGIKRH